MLLMSLPWPRGPFLSSPATSKDMRANRFLTVGRGPSSSQLTGLLWGVGACQAAQKGPVMLPGGALNQEGLVSKCCLQQPPAVFSMVPLGLQHIMPWGPQHGFLTNRDGDPSLSTYPPLTHASWKLSDPQSVSQLCFRGSKPREQFEHSHNPCF